MPKSLLLLLYIIQLVFKVPRLILKFLWVAFVPLSFQAYGQSEYFGEWSVEKKLLKTTKWDLVGEVNWKMIFNEPLWRRWGVSVRAERKLGRFRLGGGGEGYYTLNRETTNFFELRPWWSAQAKLPLSKRLYLLPKLKSEWRFFYNDGEPPKENYGRIRLIVASDIHLTNEEEAAWKLRPSIEVFLLRDPSEFERFSNERDYGLTVLHRLANGNELSFGYKYEEYLDINGLDGTGHTFALSYSL